MSESIERKIGQMIMVGFRGTKLDSNSIICEDISKGRIGGVVLFDYDVPSQTPLRNIQSTRQLKELTQSLQSFAETPLFIGIDEEGGQISRLKPERGFLDTFSHQEFGEKDCLAFTRENALKMAAQLDKLGINLNFAPCVDLNLFPKNPVIGSKGRSFSNDPDKVTRHAKEFIKAFRQHRVMTVLKHFPGHGSSKQDSHLGFVDVSGTWQQEELIPYRRLIQEHFVDAIMTAHIFNASLDNNFPATLSFSVISQLLRKALPFQDVIFSDDLQMKAVSEHYDFQEAVVNCINAGVDVLVFANNSIYDEKIARKVIRIIVKALENKRIDEQRVVDSYNRISKQKAKISIR